MDGKLKTQLELARTDTPHTLLSAKSFAQCLRLQLKNAFFTFVIHRMAIQTL